jgi:hypothetical protein
MNRCICHTPYRLTLPVQPTLSQSAPQAISIFLSYSFVPLLLRGLPLREWTHILMFYRKMSTALLNHNASRFIRSKHAETSSRSFATNIMFSRREKFQGGMLCSGLRLRKTKERA